MEIHWTVWNWIYWAGSWAIWISGSFFLPAIVGAMIAESFERRKKRRDSAESDHAEIPDAEANSPVTDDDTDQDLSWLADCLEEWDSSQSEPDAIPEWASVLRLDRPFTKERLDAAYRRQAQLTHPDHGGSAAAFRSVQMAYEEGLRSFCSSEASGSGSSYFGCPTGVSVSEEDVGFRT